MKRILLIAISAVLAVSAAQAKNEKTPSQKFDRGFKNESSLFVPKGMIAAGASMAYNRYSAGNGDVGYEMMSMLTGMKGTLSTVKASPAVMYFVSNNTAVGLRFTYSYTAMDMDEASLSLGEDMAFDLSNNYFENQKYTGSLAIRNYIPLFGSKVFAAFNEVRVGGRKVQGKSYKMNEGEKDGIYSDGYAFNLGVVPGVSAFVTNNLSFEVALSVLECNYSYTKQYKNQVYTSSMSHFGTTFKPNLLGVSFAVMYYFRTGK